MQTKRTWLATRIVEVQRSSAEQSTPRMATAVLEPFDLLPESLGNMKPLDIPNTGPSSKDHDCRFLDVLWKDETVAPLSSKIGLYALVF